MTFKMRNQFYQLLVKRLFYLFICMNEEEQLRFGQFINIQHKMVYGRILYNSIKQYTPKWFPTIPYSQTTKPVFGRQQQVISVWNSKEQTKNGWRLLGKIFQYSWAYQIFMFGLCFGIWSAIYFPVLSIYQANNKHRTFDAAIAKEKAFKKAQREKQLAEHAAEQAAAGEE